MIIPSALSDLPTNGSSEVITVMDYDPFRLKQKFNNESASEGEAVLDLIPVDSNQVNGEEFEGASDPRSVKLKYVKSFKHVCLAKSRIAPKVPLRRRRIRLQLQTAQAVSEEGEEEVLLQGRLLRARGRPLPTHHRRAAGPAHILPGHGPEAETEEKVATIPPRPPGSTTQSEQGVARGKIS